MATSMARYDATLLLSFWSTVKSLYTTTLQLYESWKHFKPLLWSSLQFGINNLNLVTSMHIVYKASDHSFRDWYNYPRVAGSSASSEMTCHVLNE